MEYKNFTLARTIIRFPLNNPNGTKVTYSKCKHSSGPFIFTLKARRYEFPHQALLGYETGEGVEWTCGGSLISSNFVLTGKQFLNLLGK